MNGSFWVDKPSRRRLPKLCWRLAPQCRGGRAEPIFSACGRLRSPSNLCTTDEACNDVERRNAGKLTISPFSLHDYSVSSRNRWVLRASCWARPRVPRVHSTMAKRSVVPLVSWEIGQRDHFVPGVVRTHCRPGAVDEMILHSAPHLSRSILLS